MSIQFVADRFSISPVSFVRVRLVALECIHFLHDLAEKINCAYIQLCVCVCVRLHVCACARLPAFINLSALVDLLNANVDSCVFVRFHYLWHQPHLQMLKLNFKSTLTALYLL